MSCAVHEVSTQRAAAMKKRTVALICDSTYGVNNVPVSITPATLFKKINHSFQCRGPGMASRAPTLQLFSISLCYPFFGGHTSVLEANFLGAGWDLAPRGGVFTIAYELGNYF